MKFYSKNNEPLTQEEIEKIKQKPEYREKIKSDLQSLDSTIQKLVLDRDKSDKIIGLVMGTEISCFLTILTDMTGITLPNDDYSKVRIVLLIASLIIRNFNLIKNYSRNSKIKILNTVKEDIINENDWLDDQTINNNQKTLSY